MKNLIKKARITLALMNDRVDDEADNFILKIIDALNTGEATVTEINNFYITVLTADRVVELWNGNKYYAWLSRADDVTHNYFGDKIYSNVRPRRSTMRKLVDALSVIDVKETRFGAINPSIYFSK